MSMLKSGIFKLLALAALVFAGTLVAGPNHGKPGFSPTADNLPPDLAMASPPAERRTWNKTPIAVGLQVNRERLVTFNAPVRLELPGDLNDSKLRTQIVAEPDSSTVYWTAVAPFEEHRIQVQDIESGNVYLLDLKASPQLAETNRMEITLPGNPASATPANALPQPAEAAGTPDGQPDYVALTRMAAQHLYAPERLLSVPDGVYQAPVRQAPTVNLFRGGRIEATPVIAWRTDSLTITAFRLKNLGASEAALDPRDLRGRWMAATFQHNLLLPNGDVRDTSAAYLISDTPYEEPANGH